MRTRSISTNDCINPTTRFGSMNQKLATQSHPGYGTVEVFGGGGVSVSGGSGIGSSQLFVPCPPTSTGC